MAKSKVRKKNKKKTKPLDYSIYKNRIKVSEILLEYARALMCKARSEEEEEWAISYAAIIWNLSFIPEKEKERCKAETAIAIDTTGCDFLGDSTEVIDMMLERKEKEYGDIKRIIQDYNIIHVGEGYKLQVTSSDIK